MILLGFDGCLFWKLEFWLLIGDESARIQGWCFWFQEKVHVLGKGFPIWCFSLYGVLETWAKHLLGFFFFLNQILLLFK